ncbi:hypothetical protein KDN32_20360 [Nocardioides sp. J2M5]|uniref:hypothetical protein n=1 Tax=Nocardioides palaemonis TaxID=2829810 RepID=UPI001BACE765|nr:hypothetical protein [Nocardioides palaemonis]MBS2940096.1 hypothetical protein [Nocardioides palaemonis]
MTTLDPDPLPADSRTDATTELACLLELTSSAWRDALDAVVFHDCEVARRVLAGARERRVAAVRARACAQAQLSEARIVLTARRLVRSVNTVQLIGDVERLEQLIVATARRVLSGRAHLDQDLRPEVAVLGRAGAQRLHDLALGRRPGLRDADYLACGRELDEVSQCLARHARALRRPDGAVGLCAALTSGVLEASRHASRAA